MKKNWQTCKKVLVIRLDNMGDLLMSTPAIHAVKKTLGCSITVLTSTTAAGIVPFIKDIDDVITADVPWVKADTYDGPDSWNSVVEDIRRHQFDGAIIFTVFSQNPMPAILLAWLAGIPNRLAYCRENPYHVLTDWVPEQEPYRFIRHQVERDLFLVSTIGAETKNHSLVLRVPNFAYSRISQKLAEERIDTSRPWIVVHPGASERKREYPIHLFKKVIEKLTGELGLQAIITGTANEKHLADELCEHAGVAHCRSMAGKLSIEEFMALIDMASLVLSVNTGTIHIAAALNTSVVVLYARTNPQHTPWHVQHEIIMFPESEELRSRNEILRYVQNNVMEACPMPEPEQIVDCVRKMLKTNVGRPA